MVKFSLMSISISELSIFPKKTILPLALFAPCVSDDAPRIIFGTATPARQPIMIPIASPQIGELSFLVKSTMTWPQNVAMKVPNKSE